MDNERVEKVEPNEEENRQYRAIGTVEEIKEILQIISEGQDEVDESGISTGLLHTLLEYAEYKKIGTVEECREARERQRGGKKPIPADGGSAEGDIDEKNIKKLKSVEFDSEPWVSKCFTKDFAHMIQLSGIILEGLDFSQPFRIEIDYDPEQPRTTIKTLMPTEVLQSRIQKALGRQKD